MVIRISQERVRQRPISGARVSTAVDPEALGGSASAARTGQAFQGLTSTLSEIALKERQRADEIKLNDATSQLAKFEVDFMKGAKAKRGENALGLPEEFDEAYEDNSQKIREGLSSDRQRLAFDQKATGYQLSMQRSINSHVENESFRYDQQATDSFLENESNAAINDFTNIDRIALSIARQKQEIKKAGDRNGLGKEWVKAKTSDAISKTHVGVTDNLIQVNTDLAKEYYNLNKSEINQKVMSSADLDKKISTYLKGNVRLIEDDLYEKLNDETLTVDEIMSVSQSPESGGIGSKKARTLAKAVKGVQEANLTNISDQRTVQFNEDKEYVNLIDKLIDNDVDNFAMKQILVDSYIDNKLTTAEKDKLNSIRKILKKTDQTLTGTILWDPSTWGFKKSVEQIKESITKENFDDKEISDALRNLVDADKALSKDQETLEKETSAIIDQAQIKKNPKQSKYVEGQIYTNKSGRKAKAVRASNGVIGLEYID